MIMALTSEKAKTSKFNQPNIQYCQYCGKECKNINSLKQHECRCKENPNRRNYNTLGSYVTENRKGKNRFNCLDIAKQSASLKEKYSNGYQNPLKGLPGSFTGRKHTEESKKKIGVATSKARIKGYANGTITPAKRVGRGKYSYIEYKDKKYMLRSTYEFIYALYLISENIDFDLEKIRVPALHENKYAKTFISDFSINNKVIEIKGIKSDKDKFEREAFENAGYEFIELYHNDIEKVKNELINKGYDVN